MNSFNDHDAKIQDRRYAVRLFADDETLNDEQVEEFIRNELGIEPDEFDRARERWIRSALGIDENGDPIDYQKLKKQHQDELKQKRINRKEKNLRLNGKKQKKVKGGKKKR